MYSDKEFSLYKHCKWEIQGKKEILVQVEYLENSDKNRKNVQSIFLTSLGQYENIILTFITIKIFYALIRSIYYYKL